MENEYYSVVKAFGEYVILDREFNIVFKTKSATAADTWFDKHTLSRELDEEMFAVN